MIHWKQFNIREIFFVTFYLLCNLSLQSLYNTTVFYRKIVEISYYKNDKRNNIAKII